jgi:hypothetical protein
MCLSCYETYKRDLQAAPEPLPRLSKLQLTGVRPIRQNDRLGCFANTGFYTGPLDYKFRDSAGEMTFAQYAGRKAMKEKLPTPKTNR